MSGRQRNEILLVCIFVLLTSPMYPSVSQTLETQLFHTSPGDTAIIQNDFGRIRVRTWENPSVEVKIRKIAASEQNLLNVDVVSQKNRGKIFIQAYFFDYASETVLIDLYVPKYLNLVIWGANPAVEISGLAGYVRANTLTGFITAEDLESSASLASEDGNIIYRATVQPSGDIRLESLRGNISCRINEGLNLRGWLRAGKKLSWNNELEMSQGSLEKQVGIGGPLLFASSPGGDVTFVIDDTIKSQANVARQTSSTLDIPASDGSFPENRKPEIRGQKPDRPPTLESDREENRAEHTDNADQDSQEANPAPYSYPTDVNPTGTGGYSLKVNVDWVYVNASVRDRYTNRAVADLQKQDFRIFENGESQRIDRFTPNEAPFNLMLLLDVSGSTKGYMDLIKDASVEFTRMIGTQDHIALATFNSRTHLELDFTNNRNRVEREIRRIKSGGGTAFYDALDRCITRFMRDLEGRKAIVVFTDGVDNQLTGDYSNGSEITFRELYRQIQEEDTLIYTIFLDTEEEHGRVSSQRNPGTLGGILSDIILGKGGSGRTNPPRGGGSGDPAYAEARRELELIADQTGGRMYSPRDIYDLSNVYSEIADDLRIQYTLGYHSTNPHHDGQWREIDVKIVNRPELAVRARKGYYSDQFQP